MALEPGALTDAIDAAFATEWSKVKSVPLPDAGKEDRRLLFAAVARGLLAYLSDQQRDLIGKLTVTDESVNLTVTYTVTETALNINLG